MHQWMIALLGLLLTPAVLAFGDHGRWNDGWGQGVTEYSATVDDETYLYLSCRMGQLNGITLNQAGQTATNNVSLRINGHTFSPLPSMVAGNDSKAFYDMWAALRSAKSLQATTQDGRTVELPVAGVQGDPARSNRCRLRLCLSHTGTCAGASTSCLRAAGVCRCPASVITQRPALYHGHHRQPGSVQSA